MTQHPDEMVANARRKYLCEAGYRRYEACVHKYGDVAYEIDDDGVANIEAVCDSAPELECEAELVAAARRHAAHRITTKRILARQQRLATTLSSRRLPERETRGEGEEQPSTDEYMRPRHYHPVVEHYAGFRRFQETLDDHF